MRYLIVMLLSSMLFILNASAQYMSTPRLSGVGLPYFQTGIFRTFSQDGSQRTLRLYIQMVNDDLTFIKNSDEFSAEIQYEIFINNKDEQYVFNRSVSKKINSPNFEETNSRKLTHTFTTDIPLPPGEYDATITVLDKNNSKQVNRKISFKIEDLTITNFLISDLMFLKDLKKDSLDHIAGYEPTLSNNFDSAGKYIYVYFASVVNDTLDTLQISYAVRDIRRNVVQENQYTIFNRSAYQEHFIRINREQLDQSRYQLQVEANYRNSTQKVDKLFSFFWTVSPESPQDLDLALKEMRYLAPWDTLKHVLKESYDQKLSYFIDFWREMDPNQETEKNELMDEYFGRVNYANQNFSTLNTDGYDTDRGRIFIKFGEPDDIERHPFEVNSEPYVIWRYYSLRKTFLFVDRTGFGDYYLHPDYLEEEYN